MKKDPSKALRIGCAGWQIPSAARSRFGEGGSVLERYGTRFNATEINSSFYRPHQASTYAKWAASVPEGFKFSVKLPRTITQYARLKHCTELLDAFQAEVAGLGNTLGVLLVQLPPSLEYDPATADAFFAAMRERWPASKHGTAIACEPRHASWQQAGATWEKFGVSRVAADPPRFAEDARPAGTTPQYWRLHGSPRIYHDAYGEARLRGYLSEMREGAWVIFDNTASGHALDDAFLLQQLSA